MKRFSILLLLLAMIAGNMNAMAQEVSVLLRPGWNWIGYPYPESVDIDNVFGGFEPMPEDRIESIDGVSEYIAGFGWFGDVLSMEPGKGFMYYSNRTENVSVVLCAPASQFTVTTTNPINITASSAVVGGMVTLPEGSHVFMQGLCWGTTPNLDIDGAHTTEQTGTGPFISLLEGLSPNTSYYIRAYAVSDYGLAYGEELNFITMDSNNGSNHEYVDLGLPSGILWATCNVGADSPEDYGNYFAWGEIQSKDTYKWTSYQYCMGNSTTLTKYCNKINYGYNGFIDNLATLSPEDDAALVNWGSDWRIPTYDEWLELYQNTTMIWTTLNGINGRLFTASNGNSLFLPAAGYFGSGNLYLAGSYGDYWSSSVHTDYPSVAWSIDFDVADCDMGYSSRYYGHSLRAVRTTSQNNTLMGAIDGLFSVSDNTQVYFSQGNLQYIGSASTPYWKFAENQWDILGTSTGQNSDDQNVDRDLFGWGMSGYSIGFNSYQPWNTSTYNSDYYAYGGYQFNLYEQTGEADWGHNSISNGGNQPNQWRTLTNTEWNYVFNTRNTPSGIRYAKANVNNVNGVILLPDDWNASSYSLSNTNSRVASFNSNIITATEWSTLEQFGAVFLPAVGYRCGTSVSYEGNGGYYWSSSYYNRNNAYYLNFLDNNLIAQYDYYRCYGFAVRLARTAN